MPQRGFPLSPGERTNRAALAAELGYRAPTPLQRGMFKPNRGPYQNDLFLFHDPHANPYGDILGDQTIQYVGQGQTRHGDQRLTSFNRSLFRHLEDGVNVHFFVKQPEGDLLYEGEVICEGVERVYRPAEKRSVLAFTLTRVNSEGAGSHEPALDFYRLAKEQLIEQQFSDPSFVDRPVVTSMAQRAIRSVAFREVVVKAYAQKCAVCGDVLSTGDFAELEAAHIVGVSERGRDDPRNGLSLCVRHHWAFDHGAFTILDDYTIRSLLNRPDPHKEIEDGASMLLPVDPALRPHPWYLQFHRAKWGATP